MTVKYDDSEDNNDFEFAQKVAKQLVNVKHITNYIPPSFINLNNLDMLTYHLEECVWDRVYFSMYTNYKAAKNCGCDIVISGQGADESWLGYYHYYPLYKFTNKEQFTTDNLLNYFMNRSIRERKNVTESAIEIANGYLDKTIKNNIPFLKDNSWECSNSI